MLSLPLCQTTSSLPKTSELKMIDVWMVVHYLGLAAVFFCCVIIHGYKIKEDENPRETTAADIDNITQKVGI